MREQNFQDLFLELERENFDSALLHVTEDGAQFNFTQNPGRAWIYKTKSQELFDLETNEILLNSWIFVGLAKNIPEPGDYFTWSAFDNSYVILRAQDRSIKAYKNTCPHRGAALTTEARGYFRGGKIECPYHGWQYDLSGRLINSRNSDLHGHCPRLDEIKVDLFIDNLIFINPKDSHSIPPISEKYQWMREKLKLHKVEEMQMIDTISSDFTRAKWLVVLENNQESYHAIIHREYLELFRGGIHGDHFYAFADFSMKVKSATVKEYMSMIPQFPHLFPHLPAKELNGWNFYYLYPNTGLTIAPHECQIDQILPVDKDTTEIRSYRFGLNTSSSKIETLRRLSHQIDTNVKAEDLELFPKIQIGINTAEDQQQFLLVDEEDGVGGLLNYIMRLAPVLGLKSPRPGQLAQINKNLLETLKSHQGLTPASYAARITPGANSRSSL